MLVKLIKFWGWNIRDPLCEIQAKVSKSKYGITNMISTINFTIISIFDMTLLSQY